jgi:diguanylate cyclase (GGDEF)-like protein
VSAILLIDDSASQRAALRAVVEASQLFDRILEAADGVAGAKLLLSEALDLVICDVEMPGLEGEKLVHLSRGRGIAFLMLTSVRDPKRRAALFRLGARDVVTKPVDPEELVARVQLHLELMRLQRELVAKNEQLELLSTTDPLTGMHNRRHLERALDLEWRRSVRYGTPLCVVLADIDHFKQVNDQHGHPAGDEVLKEVAARLTRGLRATDTAGRYGGEEFMLVLSSPPLGAVQAAERWCTEVAAAPISVGGGVRLRATISMGVAARCPSIRTPQALVAAADAALYVAKQAGRNRVELDVSARPKRAAGGD